MPRDYTPKLGRKNQVLLKLEQKSMFLVAISVGYL
jgi:hypothetical protein